MTPELIIAAVNAAIQLLAFINKAKGDLSQSGEMTPEQEAALDKKIAELHNSPWWNVQP